MRKNRGSQAVYEDPRNGGASYPSPDSPEHPVRAGKSVLRFVIALVVISVGLILLQTVFFRLKTVYVIGNGSISAEHIAALSGLVRGDNLFTVSEDEIRENLERDHWIVFSHCFKHYPGEIYLIVNERAIVATMQYLGIEYTLDIDGMVLDEYSDMNYPGEVPAVYGFKVASAIVGEKLSVRNDAQLVAYASIVSELTIQQYAERIKSINVSDPDALTLLTKDGITVQLGSSEYMRAKIGAMRTDIAYLQQLGETSGVLDVTVPEDGKFRRE